MHIKIRTMYVILQTYPQNIINCHHSYCPIKISNFEFVNKDQVSISNNLTIEYSSYTSAI